MQRSDLEKSIFAANLTRLMLENGLTQEQLAKELKIGQTTVSGWVTGKKFPRADMLGGICKFFGTNVANLLHNPTDPISSYPMNMTSAFPNRLQDIWEVLNEEGQLKVVDYARDLADNPKYLKGNTDE